MLDKLIETMRLFGSILKFEHVIEHVVIVEPDFNCHILGLLWPSFINLSCGHFRPLNFLALFDFNFKRGDVTVLHCIIIIGCC